MKTLHFLVLLAVLFVLALFFGDREFGFHEPGRLKWMQAMDLAVTAVGIAISALSALRLFQIAIQGAKPAQILPLVIALIGGLTLYQRYWAAPIALTAVVVCWLAVENFRPSDKPRDDKGP